MSTKLIILVILCVTTNIFAENVTADESKLVALVQIFRHGERSPITFYTTDPYANADYWEDLEGELTNKGKRQHEALGQYTRSVYSDFLPERYNPNILYATTTDVRRTHMSGQCNLYGIFPAVGNNIWKENVNWQPIPLHQADPYIFNGAPYNCPNYDILVADLWSQESYVDLVNKYQSVFEYLTKYTGDNITDFWDAQSIHDCLYIEDSVGYKLPEWTNTVYPEPLGTIAGTAFKSLTDTLELQQLSAGTLLDEIVNYLDAKSATPSESNKYRIYSGHDTNIAALLNTFGALDPPHDPAFASSVYIELRQRNTDDFFVNVYSKNNDDVKKIPVRNCELDCPFVQFKKELQNVIINIDQLKEKCNAPLSNIQITKQHEIIIESFRKFKKLLS